MEVNKSLLLSVYCLLQWNGCGGSLGKFQQLSKESAHKMMGKCPTRLAAASESTWKLLPILFWSCLMQTSPHQPADMLIDAWMCVRESNQESKSSFFEIIHGFLYLKWSFHLTLHAFLNVFGNLNELFSHLYE